MCTCNCNYLDYLDHSEHHDSSHYHNRRRINHDENYHIGNHHVCAIWQPVQRISALRKLLLRIGSAEPGYPFSDGLFGRKGQCCSEGAVVRMAVSKHIHRTYS